MVRVNVVSNESEVKHPAWEYPETMRPAAVALAVALLVILDGCAGVTCTPVVIVVAEKDERPRLQSEPRGLRTDELGRVKEQHREVIVSESWSVTPTSAGNASPRPPGRGWSRDSRSGCAASLGRRLAGSERFRQMPDFECSPPVTA